LFGQLLLPPAQVYHCKNQELNKIKTCLMYIMYIPVLKLLHTVYDLHTLYVVTIKKKKTNTQACKIICNGVEKKFGEFNTDNR
jgi:hypothetical protein